MKEPSLTHTRPEAFWRRPLARLGLDIRPGEGRVAGLFFLYFLFLFTCFYATKAIRQATFVDVLGAENLPYLYLAVALVAYPSLRLYGRLTERLRPHHLVAVGSLALGLGAVISSWLYAQAWSWVPAAFYLWATVGFGIAVSHFWSYASNTFDPRQARRLFGFVASGGALGGIAGGQLAHLAADADDIRRVLLVVAAALFVAPVFVLSVSRLYQADEERVSGTMLEGLREARGGLGAIRHSPYLRLLALVMVLTVVVAQIVDLQFNWGVQSSTQGLGERTSAFGNFYSLVALGAFLFHLLLTAPIQRRFGIGRTMRVLPVSVALGTVGLLLAAAVGPGLVVVAVWFLKISDGGLRHSVDQVTRELLFLPIPSHTRQKAKACIDVFVQRFAKGLAALLLLSITFGLLTPVEMGWVSLVLVAVWIGVTVRAHRLYVKAYRDGLKSGSLDPEAVLDFSDVTTVEVLVQSLGSSDPRQVLHSLELLRTHGRGRLVPPVFLSHEDPVVRRRVLEVLTETGRRDAVPLIARTLGDGDSDVRAEALRALVKLVGESAWEVMLPRLRSSDCRERATAIACLVNHRNDALAGEAGAVLSDMLSDSDPTTRREAARALGQIAEPTGQAQLVQVLYDNDVTVVREAVASVRQRITAAGCLNPLYIPTLIALMGDRRLKHDCREALAACGEAVIPALVHFMNDPNEQLWVRRASPKTIARIGGQAAARALLDTLQSPDTFLRSKTIEALLSVQEKGVDMSFGAVTVEKQLREESRQYLHNLAALVAVDVDGAVRFQGPRAVWPHGPNRPGLLVELLADRMKRQASNLLGLLGLLDPSLDTRSLQHGLFSRSVAARNHALEYLDNALTGDVHRRVFAVIDDNPPEDKLRQAERLFGVPVRSYVGTLRHLISSWGDGDPDRCGLVAAALHAAYVGRIKSLYPLILRARDGGRNAFVCETAAWVAERLGLDAGDPGPGRASRGRSQPAGTSEAKA